MLKSILIFSLYFIFIFLNSCKNIPENQFKIEKGFLNLNNLSLGENSLSLEGEWLLKENCDADDFVFAKVPGFWKDSTHPKLKNQSFGVSCYELKIKGLREKNYAIKFHEIQNAFAVFIDSKQVLKFGNPSTNQQEEIRKIGKPTIVFYPSNHKEVKLQIYISNFFESKGGIRNPPELAEEELIQKTNQMRRNFDFLTLGALFFLGFSSFFFFIITSEEKSTLYLSGISFILAIRVLFTEEHYIFEYIPHFPPILEFRIDMGSLFILVYFFILYLQSIFPDELHKTSAKLLTIPSIIILLIYNFFESDRLEFIFNLFLLYILFLIVYCLLIVFKAIYNRRTGSLVFFASVLSFFIGAANDVLSRFGIINTHFITPYTFLIFISFQSVIISIRYKNLLNFTNNLNTELEIKFRAISSSIHEAIIVMNSNAKIISTNLGALKLFEWDSLKIEVYNISDYIYFTEDKSNRSITDFILNEDWKNFSESIELFGKNLNRTHFPLECSFTSWEVNHDKYFGIILRDISSRKFLEKERDWALKTLQEDLFTAEKLQKSMLPLSKETDYPFQLNIHYNPMGPIGGDIFDIKELKEKYWRFFLADATGHGTQAALLTMAIKADYESIENVSIEPSFVLEKLNERIYPLFKNLNSLFTAFILDIDLENYIIKYSSGGHPAQVLISKDNFMKLKTQGPILGLKPNSKFTTNNTKIQKQDRIYLFSDGAYEVYNSELEELYTEENLYSYLMDSKKLIIEKIITEHISNLKKFQGKSLLDDDLTLIGIEIE
jgi:serine phosphatase RsbU (regulator of sigma subunit)